MSSIGRRYRPGLTLVEMMAGVACAAMVFFGAAIMLVGAQRQWNEGWHRAELLGQTEYSVAVMTGPLEEARDAQVSDEGRSILVHRKSDWIRFYLEGGDLRYQVMGEEPVTFVEGIAKSVLFGVTVNRVVVEVVLEDKGVESCLATTILMRNYGG